MDLSELLGLAARQRGYLRIEDARRLGVSAKTIRGWIRRREWERDGPRLLRRTGMPVDAGSSLMRAVLDAGTGAAVADGTAAAWWGLPGFDLRRVKLLRPRHISGNASTVGAVIRESLDLSINQLTVLDGIPIVRPERLAFDLFALEHPLRAARAIETAWAKGLLSGASLRGVFDELAGRGRAGTVAMREFLDAHPAAWTPPASNLEARFAEIMSAASLGTWRRQIDVGETRWVGRVDFLHERLPVIVEVQSERYHSALLDQAADAARRTALRAAGFTVIEVWDRAIWHDRLAVVAAVRRALAQITPRAA